MARIAIYGGTFNPVHFGHINLVKRFIEVMNFDKTIVMPTNIPPHKKAQITADAQTRFEMCKRAFDFGDITVSDIELKRENKSYSYDTVMQLKEMYPNDDLFFLMGSDMFLSLENWYRYNELKNLITFCVAARRFDDRSKLEQHAQKLESNGARTEIVDIDIIELSSAEIREKVMFGEAYSELVPKCIADMIVEKNLYSFETAVSFCKEEIQTKLDENRMYHSLCVAKSAECLADKYGSNRKKAYIAGLLHDITKQVSDAEQLQMLKKFDILCEDTEKENRALWHAATGYAYVKKVLGFCDNDLLNAIRYHTTSRAKASLLEDVLYIADFVSEDRNYPDVDVMREKSEKSLSEAKMYGLSYTIADNVKKNRKIGLNTVEAYNELIKC